MACSPVRVIVMARNTRVSHPADDGLLVMPSDDFPTDPNAETVGLPSDDSGKGSVPESGKFTTAGMPTEIGRYKILGIIASGGMGVVYEAMQEAPRRRVALKVIKAGAASEMALRRFDFEAQILAMRQERGKASRDQRHSLQWNTSPEDSHLSTTLKRATCL